jgi:tetratricopeptide (TPR) repeat protein
MLDCQLFGLDAGAHHLVNVGLHVVSAILLLLVFLKMTQRLWPSALVAAIFALHPMHVESVAWIAERKDVLSTLLAMLMLWLYVRYVEVPSPRRYVPVVVVFALGLMAKPMVVTLPLVLLLLDYWPLCRWTWPPSWSVVRSLVWEKTPLFVLAALDSMLTFEAQRGAGAVTTLVHAPFSARLANSAVAYVSYMDKAVWPVNLAVLYPVHDVPAALAVAAGSLILVLTAGAVWAARRRPYVFVGWFWYVGMLVPAIGLVHVGAQSMADRYTYLPFVGLSVVVVWGAADLVRNRPPLGNIAAGVAVLAIVLMAATAYRQTMYWNDSQTLFERTLAVTEGNFIIHNNLGAVLAREGRDAEAIPHFRQAVTIEPDYGEAHANLGHELLKTSQFDMAFSELSDALRLKPDLAAAQADMGMLMTNGGRLEEARQHFEIAERLAPANAFTLNNLCNVLRRLGRGEEAVARCAEALRLNPDFLEAHYNMGKAYAALGRKAEASAEFLKVLALDPSHAGARAALESLGK